jgi:hypothetical protein
MEKRLFIAAVSFLVLSACNNSGKGSDKGSDTTNKMMSDTSHTMSMNSFNVPDVPAVPDGAKVFFKNLKDGATIKSPFKVQMGVDKMKVDTAGPVVAGSGHFHIFVDAEDSLPLGTVVPKDSTHFHYGKGQTEAELTLAPGKHKLTLQFADGIHRSYGSKMATTVNVMVKK